MSTATVRDETGVAPTFEPLADITALTDATGTIKLSNRSQISRHGA